MDKLTIAIIRSLNSPVVNSWHTDEELLDRYGNSAQILADGIRETIREEVQRILSDV